MVLNDGQVSRAEPEIQLALRLISLDVEHNCPVSSFQLYFQASHYILGLLYLFNIGIVQKKPSQKKTLLSRPVCSDSRTTMKTLACAEP